jgi:hypothetical protein
MPDLKVNGTFQYDHERNSRATRSNVSPSSYDQCNLSLLTFLAKAESSLTLYGVLVMVRRDEEMVPNERECIWYHFVRELTAMRQRGQSVKQKAKSKVGNPHV